MSKDGKFQMMFDYIISERDKKLKRLKDLQEAKLITFRERDENKLLINDVKIEIELLSDILDEMCEIEYEEGRSNEQV